MAYDALPRSFTVLESSRAIELSDPSGDAYTIRDFALKRFMWLKTVVYVRHGKVHKLHTRPTRTLVNSLARSILPSQRPEEGFDVFRLVVAMHGDANPAGVMHDVDFAGFEFGVDFRGALVLEGEDAGS